MCGICGFIGEVDDSKKVLKQMMDKIAHRGPDDEGMYVDKHAAIGHRRLSIIDLSHGAQPMYNETGDVAIVFNGEIYNHLEIRKELIAKGHKFANDSDTECLIHGYEEYGTDLLSKLRGMFAFVIWDTRTNTMFGARDHFGIKPFYYSLFNKTLIFASETKSILEFPGFKKELNEEALEQYLSFQYSVLPETFFKGIFRLPAGHYMIFKDGKLDVQRYFDPMMEPAMDGDLEKTVSEIEEVVHDTVDAHMIADVEVGSLLSSGVDSSYVVSEFPGDKTFTVGFLDKQSKYNEIRYAEGLVRELGKKNYNKNIDSEEYFKSIPTVMYYMDEPLADPSCIALYFVDKLAAEQIKVVLSGEGADEFFGGYNIYREPESLKKIAWIPFGVRRVIGKLAAKLPDVKGRDFLIRAGMKVEERFIGNAYIYREKEKAQILKNKVTGPSTQEYLRPFFEELESENRGSLQDMEKMQSVDLRYWLPGDILQKADKMSMAHSLEVRVPFLDKEVFDFAAKLPKEAKIAAGTTKYIFRKAVSQFIPQETDERKKLGFPIPIRVWLRQDDWYQMVTDLFTSKEAEEFFHTEKLLQLLNDHKDKKADNSRKIWTVLTFLIWYDRFFATCSK